MSRKTILLTIASGMLWILSPILCTGGMLDGIPVKFTSGLEADFNHDGLNDVAMVLETSEGQQLMVMMNNGNGYKTHILKKLQSNMVLSCYYDRIVKGTTDKNKEYKEYESSGANIKLKQPEGSAVVFFWNGKGFTEIWTEI